MNVSELELIERYIRENNKVLDIGCGDGELLRKLKRAKRLGRSVGIDVEKGEKCDFEFYQMSAEDFQINEKFEVIIISHTLEHLKTPIACLEQCKKHLVQFGKILIMVPNRFGFRNEAKIWFPEHGKHYWLFDEESLRFLLRGLGFVCRFHPTNFPGINNKYLLAFLKLLFPKRSSTIFCVAMKE